MPDGAKLVVKGDKELRAKFKKMRRRDVRSAISFGLRGAGGVFKSALKKGMPKKVDGISKDNLKILKGAIRVSKVKAKPRGINAQVRGVWIGISTNVMITYGIDDDEKFIGDDVKIPAVSLAKQIEFGSQFINAQPWFRKTFEQQKTMAVHKFSSRVSQKIVTQAKKKASGGK